MSNRKQSPKDPPLVITSHEKWMNEKVQTSLADPRPNVSHDTAMTKIQALIDDKRKKHSMLIRVSPNDSISG